MLWDMSKESQTDRMKRLVRLLVKKALAFVNSQPQWHELPRWEPIVSVYNNHETDTECMFAFYAFYWEEKGVYYLRPACTYHGDVTVLLPGHLIECLTTDFYFVTTLISSFESCKDYVETARQSAYEYFYYGGGVHVYKNLRRKLRATFGIPIEDDWYKTFDVNRTHLQQQVKLMLSTIVKYRDNEELAEKIGDHFVGSVSTRLFSGHTFGIRIVGAGTSDDTFRPYYKTKDDRYFEMLSCPRRDVPDEVNDTFVENLCDYYVYMLALESGLAEPEWVVKEFSKYRLKRGLMGYSLFVRGDF